MRLFDHEDEEVMTDLEARNLEVFAGILYMI